MKVDNCRLKECFLKIDFTHSIFISQMVKRWKTWIIDTVCRSCAFEPFLSILLIKAFTPLPLHFLCVM